MNTLPKEIIQHITSFLDPIVFQTKKNRTNDDVIYKYNNVVFLVNKQFFQAQVLLCPFCMKGIYKKKRKRKWMTTYCATCGHLKEEIKIKVKKSRLKF